MKILNLNQKLMTAFEGLDPLEIRKQKGFTSNFMLGAIRDGEERDVPAGLLLGNAEKKELTIRWLFVDPESRRKSYAERLLSEAFLAAKEKGLNKLAVLFPKVYGYRSLCRHDRAFFRNHGFHEEEDGRMTADLSDYEKYTEYDEPEFFDDTEMLDRLLASRVEDEEDEEPELVFEEIHKPWEVRKMGLRELSRKPAIQNFIQKVLSGKKALTVGSIGELSFTQFREVVELCEKRNHTGFLKSLYDMPVDYFDLMVSSYTITEAQVSGMCLVHHNEQEKTLTLELLYTADEDNARSLAELMRYTIIAANENYDSGTTVILPYDEKDHKPVIEKFFGE